MRTLELEAGEVGEAARLLREGRLVAFPTETVYGLGADARDDIAVARIFEAKGRPQFNPLIVHLPDMASVEAVAELSPDAARLAEAFWPGPMTLVLPRREAAGLSPLVSAGLPSIAVRVPSGALARSLLTQAGIPVAAPSANPSGRVSPTRAAHVLRGLSGRIDAVLDGGPCAVGLESTILQPRSACEGGGVRLLRPGGLAAEAVEACLGAPLLPPPAPGGTDGETPAVTAPGQLASHYAPAGRIRLDADAAEPGEVLLGFGPVEAAYNLSSAGDLVEAAANLFGHLQALDRAGVPRIAVSPVPRIGLGRAINDRLARAAAPR
ncbi:PTS system fructose-specific IIA component [Profundibacterium mesophilum KAUST100406-0324]|uniref:Threonylcarbamoyl-AMP synthase n=1 Tax=Profundibacterium mesophilum KAUST100406-0324 TaxID=1037889 RepID=A0A921NQ19_9RHOB|nr:L-threonylcarbamoyladenylate synthase [Profundibacterium mesophilum]KAF0675967.1 PTS system fructose-specific IIA component [Profundibacterium mesophilum KAUST100406-0324]